MNAERSIKDGLRQAYRNLEEAYKCLEKEEVNNAKQAIIESKKGVDLIFNGVKRINE